MKKIFLLIAVTTITFTGICQNTLVLQPGPSAGKDAYLQSRYPNNNFGNYPDIIAAAWSWGQVMNNSLSLFQFDLSQLPPGIIVTSAKLNLYKSPNSQQAGHFGDNQAYLRRVLFDWNENLVTYNNQPMTTTDHEILLAPSKDANQDYVDIDVTQLVTDMVNDPSFSYGFMLQLVTEERYRSLVFASSDHPNPALRPKLVVHYLFNQDTIRGSLSYSNTDATPLANVIVKLFNENNILKDSTISNINGDFSFIIGQPGNYSIVPQPTLAVNGINSYDALLALKHFTGMLPLQGLFFKAADVDVNQVVNSTDAVEILYRFIGRITTFPAGDWVFDATNITVPYNNPNKLIIKGLCVGDLNASWRN